MRARQRVNESLRRLGKASPRGIRGPLGRASRRFRPGWGGPLVTVVLPVNDGDTTRIGPCLDDLRGQLYRNIEVRVQPWGRSTEVRRVAREHAEADWRVIVSRDTAADPAAARNAGAASARGTYLLFADGGDNVPPRGLGRLVSALEDSGSDLAVGRMRMPMGVLPRMDSPFTAAHQTPLTGTDLAAAPVAVTDLGLGNRMLRRRFWRESGLAFTPERSNGVDVALASYARAGRFDLLAEDTYIPTNRRAGVSVGSMPDVLGQLDDWVADHELTWGDLSRLDLPDVRDWWLWGVLDTAIQPFVDDVERADDDQWRRLREHVRLLLETAGETAWSALSADSRVKLWLLRNDRRTELEEFVIQRLFERGNRPTDVVDGAVVADLPFRGDRAVGVPDDCYVMTQTETPLVVDLREVRWPAPDRIELDLLAFVDHVSITEPPEVSVSLVRPGSGERLPLTVRSYVDPRANQLDGRPYQDFSHGALVAEVDAHALAEASRPALDDTGEPLRWTVDVRLRTRGLTRRGGITRLEDRGSAAMLWSGMLAPRVVDDLRLGPVGTDPASFALEVRPERGARLVEAHVDGRRVRGALRAGATDLRAVRVQMGSVVGKAPLTRDGDLLRFDLEVPQPWAGRAHVRWELVALTGRGGTAPVGWTWDQAWRGAGDGTVVLSRSSTGDVELLESAATLVLDSVELAPGRLDVTGTWLGTPPADARLVLAGRGARQVAALESDPAGPAGGVRAAVPTVWDPWGLGERPLPVGRYLFELEGSLPESARVLVGAGVLDRLLTFTVEHGYRFRPVRNGTEAGVQLLPPLTDDERGPFAQANLQRWARTGDLPIDPDAVYLQSYSGASATDSQLAIHRELRRRHPGLRLYWGVGDSSSWVPEGGIPVQMNSREWYRVLATSRHLCLNIDFDRWFAKRPGQRVLQTFHGYPAKSMGIRMWEAKGYTARRIGLELDRTSRDWDLILTPAPEMDEYYRREYRYDGAIHSSGYPRDDALVAPDADAVRAETRARLGIRPEQKVVLYAPTWRDDLATNWRNAELVAHLDVETASRRLGPDYVMLMRGHRFHQRPEASSTSTRMIDVSDYPEINDLILASDAAVLDYSSLRFDFALSGRPMIFLVPDLAAYTGGVRGFLYPFEESAPGPLVDTADEVIDWLRRLPELSRTYAGELDRFHRTYNYLQDGHSAERVVQAFWG